MKKKQGSGIGGQGSARLVAPTSWSAVARASRPAHRIWRLGSKATVTAALETGITGSRIAYCWLPRCSRQLSALSKVHLLRRTSRAASIATTTSCARCGASFTESYEGLGMKRTESGTMLLEKPGRMRWDYSSPSGKLFLLDGSFAWFYSPGDPQVQRLPAKDLDDLRSPLRFLLGHASIEKEIADLKIAPAPNGCYTLSGQPKGEQARVARLTLTVTAEGAITAIEVEELDGAITRFAFTGEEPNAAIPAGSFRFTPPEGIPVVGALPPV